MSVSKFSLRRRRNLLQKIVFNVFRLAALINGLALFIIVYFMIANGWRAISWTFLTQPPMDSMTKGGILPCIVGTLCLSIGASGGCSINSIWSIRSGGFCCLVRNGG